MGRDDRHLQHLTSTTKSVWVAKDRGRHVFLFLSHSIVLSNLEAANATASGSGPDSLTGCGVPAFPCHQMAGCASHLHLKPARTWRVASEGSGDLCSCWRIVAVEMPRWFGACHLPGQQKSETQFLDSKPADKRQSNDERGLVSTTAPWSLSLLLHPTMLPPPVSPSTKIPRADEKTYDFVLFSGCLFGPLLPDDACQSRNHLTGPLFFLRSASSPTEHHVAQNRGLARCASE